MVKKNIKKSKKKYSTQFLLELYDNLITPRLIEERMLLLLRQGRVSKWFSGIGQEAISVGATMALEPDEYIFPLHRNLGVFTSRKVPLTKLFAQWQGKETGFTKGRDRSFHFGTQDYNIVGMISHLGPQLALAGGTALAHRLKKEKKISLAFTGEGGTSEGDFHEALNVASVWDLPVIFLIENNGYGLSTPTEEQYNCKKLADRALGYGIEGITIDGNDILEVYETISYYASKIRKEPKPVLVECMTFRMRGHEEASGVKYVPPELFKKWEKKDPILLFEKRLISEFKIDKKLLHNRKQELLKTIIDQLEAGFDEPEVSVSLEKELNDVYKEHKHISIVPNDEKVNKRFIDAISDGLYKALEKYPDLIIMGQDIAEYGGVFKITEGFVKKFGKDRIRNTPICESAVVGVALGLSLKGVKSVVEMQFADFVSCGFNQIVNNLAKLHYRWGQNADVVIRMPTGAGSGAGPFHSQSNEAWFTHVAGLKVVYPSNPYDAKGLLLEAIADPNPVLFFEHKGLYRSSQGEVPSGYYSLELGKGRFVSEGNEIGIITYGMGVRWAEKIKEEMPHISFSILDLRTLMPLDYTSIEKIVSDTGRIIILHEDTLFGGIGGEISAYISENLFEYLDAPVFRCASLDTPVPFTTTLEAQFLASSRLRSCVEKLSSY